MSTQTQKIVVSPDKKLFIKMVVDAWETQTSRIGSLLEKLSDEQLTAEIAPGKNRGIYLLGHLTATNDNLLPLLGFGEKLFPQLEDIFLKNPDKSGLETPSIAELKKSWNEVNERLQTHFAELSDDQWFARHNAVSDEDFAAEPHRNRLNVLMGRTNHQSYHLGQLLLLKK